MDHSGLSREGWQARIEDGLARAAMPEASPAAPLPRRAAWKARLRRWLVQLPLVGGLAVGCARRGLALCRALRSWAQRPAEGRPAQTPPVYLPPAQARAALRVVIATAYVPFGPSRERRMAEELRDRIRSRGHHAELVLLPFKAGDDEAAQMLAFRLTDLSEGAGDTIDRLVALGAAAGVLAHPRKTTWLVERGSALSGLGGGWPPAPEDDGARARAGLAGLREAFRVVPASRTAAHRLKTDLGMRPADPLYVPPLPAPESADAPVGGAFLVLGALAPVGRQLLALEALRFAPPEVRLTFAGPAADPAYLLLLERKAQEWGVSDRARFPSSAEVPVPARLLEEALGAVTLGVEQFSPDDGVMEAFQACRPVLAALDAGAPADLIDHQSNGLRIAPDPRLLASELARLARKPEEARVLGRAGRDTLRRHRISWDAVAERLLR